MVSLYGQGIIDLTETETFVKDPKLANLLRELKSTPMSCNEKKKCWFFLQVCNGKFAVF